MYVHACVGFLIILFPRMYTQRHLVENTLWVLYIQERSVISPVHLDDCIFDVVYT